MILILRAIQLIDQTEDRSLEALLLMRSSSELMEKIRNVSRTLDLSPGRYDSG